MVSCRHRRGAMLQRSSCRFHRDKDRRWLLVAACALNERAQYGWKRSRIVEYCLPRLIAFFFCRRRYLATPAAAAGRSLAGTWSGARFVALSTAYNERIAQAVSGNIKTCDKSQCRRQTHSDSDRYVLFGVKLCLDQTGADQNHENRVEITNQNTQNHNYSKSRQLT